MNLQIIEEEISFLKEIDFLIPADTAHDINKNDCKTWAEAFWLRRKRHSNRLDPEIPFIFKHNPKSVLEIGAAYGRVLNKIAIANKNPSVEIIGIEKCGYFKQFFKKYSEEYPILNSTSVIFEDFFTTSKLNPDYFDVIVLPMNTLPNIPIEDLDKLFPLVKRYLKENGQFVFSAHKFPLEQSLENHSRFSQSLHSGELLTELNNSTIASEFYNFPGKTTPYGGEEVTYSIYHKLTRDYQLMSRELYRSVIELIHPVYLSEIIHNHDFEIDNIDENSHSAVYTLILN